MYKNLLTKKASYLRSKRKERKEWEKQNKKNKYEER